MIHTLTSRRPRLSGIGGLESLGTLYLSSGSGAGPIPPPPDAIANLEAWWNPETLEADYNSGEPLNLGWQDVQNNHDATPQATNTPTYTTGTPLNGYGAVDFQDGCALEVNTLATNLFVPCTIAAVINIASFSNTCTILGGGTNGALQLRVNPSGNLQLIHQSVALIGADVTVLVEGNPYFVAVTYSATGDWKFYINGILGSTGNSLVSPASGIAMLGGREGLTEDFIGLIYEELVYLRDLTAIEITALQAYVNYKFGI